MDLNTCLCGNWGNFVILAAICIGKDDKADAVPVYKTMVSACADSNTPLNVAPNVFYGAVNGQVTTTTSAATTMTTSTSTTSATTSATTTTTATPTGTSTAAPVSENLSTGATIGIALGASFGGVGAIAGLVWFLLRRSKKQGEEFHPMLPNSTEEARFSSFSGQPPLSEPTPSPGIASTFSEAKRASWVSPLQSPDPYRYSAATWDATQGVYKGPYAPPEGAVELPPQTASVASSSSGMVFEMDATTSQLSSGPVEIQGDVPFTDHGRR